MRPAWIPATCMAFAFLLGCSVTDDEDVSSLSGGGTYSDSYPGAEKSHPFTPHAFVPASEDNLSTFGLDVDKASYTFHRKKVLQEGMLPDPRAVRTEEFLNYFGFSCANGRGDDVFRIEVETARSAFRDSLVNLRIGLEARDSRPAGAPWNLTFLVDVSGSMTERLELVKRSLGYLVDAMRPGDRISVATYAGSVSTVLEPTTLAERDKAAIKGILGDLKPGGGTAMSDGLANAYAVNRRGYLDGGVNRVIVCSDGDANIGAAGWDEMLKRIREYKDDGITLSTLGFGLGNFNDANMEMLADRGNGNYYYIDSDQEAQRLFREELTSMMQVVAWDSKVQVEFDEAAVRSYRLLGYENRDIADTAFKNDTTDAGELGAGHTVTALYELVLENPAAPLGTLHLRYRDAAGVNRSLDRELGSFTGKGFAQASTDFRFAFAVAEYAEILRGSGFVGTGMQDVAAMLKGLDAGGDSKRTEFAQIVAKAAGLPQVKPVVIE